MATKRANGPGSGYRRKDGKWLAAINIGGKRIVTYASTQDEAETLHRSLIVTFGAGTLTPPSPLILAEWAGQWLEIIGIDSRPSTHATYRRALAPSSRGSG